MSLKSCIRVIPVLLKQRNAVQILISSNKSLLHKPSCCYFTGYSCNSLRCFSNDNKHSEQPKVIQVYYGTLTTQIRLVKLFSLLTSITGIAAQPILYKQILGLNNLPVTVVLYSFVGFFTLVTPFLLHFITKKYVTALDYNEEKGTYIAKTLNMINMEKTLEFTPEDVKVPEVLGMFTSFQAKNVPLFIDPRLFKDPFYYGKLMGYDKPLDLKLFQTSMNEKEK